MGGILWTSLVLMGVALLLTGVRLLRGPSDFDRLLAAETLGLGVVGLLMLRAGKVDDTFYVDAALGLALFSFVGTVVCVKFLERRRGDE
jgi:multisubunit Na+/H+ antiporter MnhF subunit